MPRRLPGRRRRGRRRGTATAPKGFLEEALAIVAVGEQVPLEEVLEQVDFAVLAGALAQRRLREEEAGRLEHLAADIVAEPVPLVEDSVLLPVTVDVFESDHGLENVDRGCDWPLCFCPCPGP